MSDLQCPARVYVVTGGEAHQRPSGVQIASVYTWSAGEVSDVRAALDELADRHRGESVLVLVDEAQACGDQYAGLGVWAERTERRVPWCWKATWTDGGLGKATLQFGC